VSLLEDQLQFNEAVDLKLDEHDKLHEKQTEINASVDGGLKEIQRFLVLLDRKVDRHHEEIKQLLTVIQDDVREGFRRMNIRVERVEEKSNGTYSFASPEKTEPTTR
jgi:hypothetical protein